jgi:hypothetical protein
MRGKCESCGMEDVDIQPYKAKNEVLRNICNQCRPADGAYAY